MQTFICPKCGMEMRKIGRNICDITVIVERCISCAGEFFDSGEIELLTSASENMGRKIYGK